MNRFVLKIRNTYYKNRFASSRSLFEDGCGVLRVYDDHHHHLVLLPSRVLPRLRPRFIKNRNESLSVDISKLKNHKMK